MKKLMENLSPHNLEHTAFDDKTFLFSSYHIYGTSTSAHWHNHLEILLPLNGICNVLVNGVSYSVSQNQFILLPPGSLHSITPLDKCYHVAVVIGDTLLKSLNSDTHFSDIVYPFMSVGKYMPLVISSLDHEFENCYKLAAELIEEYKQKKGMYKARIKSLVLLFLSSLYDNLPPAYFENCRISESTRLIKSSLDYISLHYSEKITVRDISEYYHLSTQHFCRLFKAYTGKTFVEYLTWYRLEQSRKILTGTDIPIIQIPDLVGLCNGNYFSRLYRKYYGKAPSKDRNPKQKPGAPAPGF